MPSGNYPKACRNSTEKIGLSVKMMAGFGVPCLSYAQLYSFQVLYSNNADSRGLANSGAFSLLGRKKGEWKRAILEIDFTMGTLFLQDKDRIILSESFEDYKKHKTQEERSDDMLVSIRFKSDQWEIMVQNIVEKRTLQHLLKCILHDLNPQEAAESGLARGLTGLDKNIMKYGLVHRRAKTAYKKDERFLIVVPGKLILFKNMDIVGAHVRFVTSLFRATTRLVYGQLEFEVMVPDTKSLNILTLSAEELTAWIGAIDKSATFANEDALVSSGLNSQGAMTCQSEGRKKDFGYRDSRYAARGKSGFSPRYSNTKGHCTARARDGSDEEREKGYEGKYDGDYRRSSKYQPRDEDKGSSKQARSRDHRNEIRDKHKGSNVEATGNTDTVTGISQSDSRTEVDRSAGSGSGRDKEKVLLSRKMRMDDREGHSVSAHGETETNFYYSKQNNEASSSVGKTNAAPSHRKSAVSQSKQRALDETQFDMPHARTMVNDNEEKQDVDYNSGKGRDFDDHQSWNSFRRHKERESIIENNYYPRDDRVDAYEPPNYAREKNAWKNEHAQMGGANRASLSRQLSQKLNRQISLREPADNQHMKERDLRDESASASNLRRESWWSKREMRDTSTQTSDAWY